MFWNFYQLSWQEFDFPAALNFEYSTVVIIMPLVLIMKDKDEELPNLGLKAFAIGTGDEKVFAEGATVGESFFKSSSYSIIRNNHPNIVNTS